MPPEEDCLVCDISMARATGGPLAGGSEVTRKDIRDVVLLTDRTCVGCGESCTVLEGSGRIEFVGFGAEAKIMLACRIPPDLVRLAIAYRLERPV